MKKVMLTILFFAFVLIGFSQTTYYWVGGIATTSYTSTSNWNTDINGAGISRSAAGALVTDILIFDGTNVGGTTPTTGVVNATVSSQTCGKLIVQNGANINLTRASAGSGAITIAGDTGDDFIVDATSTLTLGGPLYNYDVSVVLSSAATGLINGTVYLSPLSTSVHTRSYITSAAAGSLVFATGSNCYITDSTASSGFNGSVANSVVFKTGASLYYYSGRSPIGSSSTLQFINFEPGSNCYFRGSNVSYLDGITVYSSSSWVNNKTLANVYIQNNATITADGPVYKIENFTIDNLCKFITHSTGNTAVIGNLTVDGTLVSPVGGTTNAIVMGGTNPQTISGSGTINILSLVVANLSDVTLSKNITLATVCNITGKLNLGSSSQISGTATFTSRVNGTAADATGNTTAGVFQITGASALTGNTGLSITCTTPGVLSPNTNVIGFGTGIIYLSKAALTTATGATFKFYSDSATLVTSNANGLDSLTGGIIVTGTKSYQSGTNYIINAATAKPFGISSGSTVTTAGNVTLNAPVTTNFNTRITGTLTLNSGKFTIRSVDTVRLTTPTTIAGAPFNTSKYIVTEKSGASVGALRIDGFTTAALFPIGSSTNYLPVTLTPATVDTFLVNVFEGATIDGTPNGTAMDAGQKARIVDAIWTVKRYSGNTDACTISTGFTTGLEGSIFTTLANNQIGLSNWNGTNWTAALGSGDNVANTATSNNYITFGAFGVGQVGLALPAKLTDFTAVQEQSKIKLTWNADAEINVSNYVIEKSTDGTIFNTMQSLNTNNSKQYTVYDFSPSLINYYRIKIVDKNGSITYSNILKIKTATTNAEVLVYPNPIKNGLLNVQLSNLEKGKTSIVIYNNSGQIVSSIQFDTEAGSTVKSILLPKSLAKGIYKIAIKNNNSNFQQQILVD